MKPESLYKLTATRIKIQCCLILWSTYYNIL